MKAEEVYNIAIYLPEKEMERLYTFLEKRLKKAISLNAKAVKAKLITDKEARDYILKTVFGREMENKV